MSSERTRRRTFYKDWGSGHSIVFSHGWPLSADDWDAQMMFFLGRGYRVIAHDRRGHGRSAQVADGHDMDHYPDVKPRVNKGRSRAASPPVAEWLGLPSSQNAPLVLGQHQRLQPWICHTTSRPHSQPTR